MRTAWTKRAVALEVELRKLCDPEAVDRRAKDDQRQKAEFWGGNEAILNEALIVYTPPPSIDPPATEGAA